MLQIHLSKRGLTISTDEPEAISAIRRAVGKFFSSEEILTGDDKPLDIFGGGPGPIHKDVAEKKKQKGW